MIKKLEISAQHFELDPKLKSYALRKIGKLDKFLPRSTRTSAHAEVKLKVQHARNKKQCVCEVVLRLPKDTITINEATINMYAAVDIVEAKLRNQIKSYKDKHMPAKLHHRALARFKNLRKKLEG